MACREAANAIRRMGYRLQAMSFLVGTPESTAAAMSFCVHCLAAHPAAQAALMIATVAANDAGSHGSV